jgi:hypothetical protein
MFTLIFIAYINGVPQPPSYVGQYVSDSACASMARRIASAGRYQTYSFVCDDGRG